MKTQTETVAPRENLLRRNLLLVATYVAVMILIAGAYA